MVNLLIVMKANPDVVWWQAGGNHEEFTSGGNHEACHNGGLPLDCHY
jgi:hypothetical protein